MQLEFYKISPTQAIKILLNETEEVDYFLLVKEEYANVMWANGYPIIFSITGNNLVPYVAKFESIDEIRGLIFEIINSSQIIGEEKIDTEGDTND